MMRVVNTSAEASLFRDFHCVFTYFTSNKIGSADVHRTTEKKTLRKQMCKNNIS